MNFSKHIVVWEKEHNKIKPKITNGLDDFNTNIGAQRQQALTMIGLIDSLNLHQIVVGKTNFVNTIDIVFTNLNTSEPLLEDVRPISDHAIVSFDTAINTGAKSPRAANAPKVNEPLSLSDLKLNSVDWDKLRNALQQQDRNSIIIKEDKTHECDKTNSLPSYNFR